MTTSFLYALPAKQPLRNTTSVAMRLKCIPQRPLAANLRMKARSWLLGARCSCKDYQCAAAFRWHCSGAFFLYVVRPPGGNMTLGIFAASIKQLCAKTFSPNTTASSYASHLLSRLSIQMRSKEATRYTLTVHRHAPCRNSIYVSTHILRMCFGASSHFHAGPLFRCFPSCMLPYRLYMLPHITTSAAAARYLFDNG